MVDNDELSLEQELAGVSTFLEAGTYYMLGDVRPVDYLKILARALELAIESQEASSLLEILPGSLGEKQEHADRIIERALELAKGKADLDTLIEMIHKYIPRFPTVRKYYEKVFARSDELGIPRSS